ncbi:MAG: hypothetical protein P0Y62_13430 [Candidatus Chryseobacterium colombiense]|nr:hypothetical protein [Chryseobacterium sp.]WEK68845.1 MAG: hypothetical protein P0Y62_13430 [Chryseobacterium sp.]
MDVVRSKINIESFLGIYFATFITSIVFSAIIFDSIKNILNEFSILFLLKSLFSFVCLIFIWVFFINIHTKILITKNDIKFKKLFKTESYDFENLNFYFEKVEPSKFKNYKGIFIVKEDKVIARISSFDYSNYEEIKENIKIDECKNVGFSIVDAMATVFGQNIRIANKKSKNRKNKA